MGATLLDKNYLRIFIVFSFYQYSKLLLLIFDY